MYSKTFCSLHTPIPPSPCLSPCSFLRLCHYLCLSLSIHTPRLLPMITPLSVPMPVPHAHAYAHVSCSMPLPMPMIYCLSPLLIILPVHMPPCLLLCQCLCLCPCFCLCQCLPYAPPFALSMLINEFSRLYGLATCFANSYRLATVQFETLLTSYGSSFLLCIN
jgi:hypothetical protein